VQPLLAVVDDVLDVGVGDQLAAPVEFGAQGGESAHPRRALQVSHDVHAVRQRAERLEGRAALVVHQHKVDHAGIVLDGQADDQRQQQFGLAGAGGAGDHAVHAVAICREQQRAHLVAGHQADGHAQTFGRFWLARAPPVLQDGDFLNRLDAVHLQQVDRRRQVCAVGSAHGEGGQLAGEVLLGAARIEQVCLTDVAQRVDAHFGVAEGHFAVVHPLHLDHSLAIAGDQAAIGHDEDNRRPQTRPLGEQDRDSGLGLHLGQRGVLAEAADAIHHHQQVRQGGIGVAVFVGQA